MEVAVGRESTLGAPASAASEKAIASGSRGAGPPPHCCCCFPPIEGSSGVGSTPGWAASGVGSGAARGVARGAASGVGANIGGGGMKLLAVGRGEVRGAGKAVDMDDSSTLSSASCNGRQHVS